MSTVDKRVAKVERRFMAMNIKGKAAQDPARELAALERATATRAVTMSLHCLDDRRCISTAFHRFRASPSDQTLEGKLVRSRQSRMSASTHLEAGIVVDSGRNPVTTRLFGDLITGLGVAILGRGHRIGDLAHRELALSRTLKGPVIGVGYSQSEIIANNPESKVVARTIDIEDSLQAGGSPTGASRNCRSAPCPARLGRDLRNHRQHRNIRGCARCGAADTARGRHHLQSGHHVRQVDARAKPG